MLHHERQPVVCYTKFPSNVEALSISVSSPKRRSSHESSPSSSTAVASTTPISLPLPTTAIRTQSPELNQSSIVKRRQTLAACRPCQRRKSRCDGTRPRCNTCLNKVTSCVYSVGQGKTPHQASREEFKAYKAVVLMLRRASSPETTVILCHLRRYEDIGEAVKFIEADMMLRGAVLPSQA